MTGRGLDAAVAAQFMRWTSVCQNGATEVLGTPPGWSGVAKVPQFHNDYGWAWSVEAEIERRGLSGDYIKSLCEIVSPDELTHHGMYWKLRRATPEQVCQAALRAVREREGRA